MTDTATAMRHWMSASAVLQSNGDCRGVGGRTDVWLTGRWLLLRVCGFPFVFLSFSTRSLSPCSCLACPASPWSTSASVCLAEVTSPRSTVSGERTGSAAGPDDRRHDCRVLSRLTIPSLFLFLLFLPSSQRSVRRSPRESLLSTRCVHNRQIAEGTQILRRSSQNGARELVEGMASDSCRCVWLCSVVLSFVAASFNRST